MSVEQNKQIMRRMIEEIWNKGNLLVADELFAPDTYQPQRARSAAWAGKRKDAGDHVPQRHAGLSHED